MKKHLLSDLELEELSQLAEVNDTVQEKLEDMGYSPAETPNVLVDELLLSAENLPADIQTLQQKIMDHLPTDQGQKYYLPKFRYKLTNEILAQTYLALETIPTVNITETNAMIYATVKALQESVGKKGSRPQTPRNALQQRLERKLKRLRSDASKLSEVAKRNATNNQEWLKKLRDTPFTTALETAKQRLVALAAQLKRYNSENKACAINKLFSTNASKIYTMLRNGNQSVDQPDPPKKETEMFWNGIWEKDASHNNKAKWIAELKADHQASVIQQQP